MVNSIDIGELDGLELEPVAILNRDVLWFEARGMSFSPGLDDLDSYRIAAIEIEAGLRVAVRRYDHAPYPGPDLLIPACLLDEPDLQGLLARISHVLGDTALEIGPDLLQPRSASTVIAPGHGCVVQAPLP